MRWYRAVALDLDGTLTTGGWPSADVLERMAELRADGAAMILVTGRILSQLDVEFPGLADRFDVIVGENGGVLRASDGTRLLAEPVDDGLLRRLHDAGFAVDRGAVLLATTATADHTALDAIEDLGLDVHLTRNRQALMLLPAGVSKGTGLREALVELGVSRHNTVAVGDAENDHPLLAAAGLGVAVGNAVTSLRRRADLVLPDADGAAVAALLKGPLMSGGQRMCAGRWHITLGQDLGGRAVTIPAAQTSMIISGGSGSGKSYLAGMIVEQLVAQGFVTFVLDPEGDHVSLGTLHEVNVSAGADLPPPGDVLAAFDHGATGVVLDLSQLDPADRDRYVATLWQPLSVLRRDTGRPHWTVLDEAQDVGWCRTAPPLPENVDTAGLCLVSYRPHDLAPVVRRAIEWHIELAGGRTAMVTPPAGTPFAVSLARRTTGHVRHWHKYVDNDLPPDLRFVFREAGSTAPVAANLRAFMTALDTVPPAAIRHHAERGDFSRWLADVYRDHLLVGLVRTTEQDFAAHGDVERTRRVLSELMAYRYRSPRRSSRPR